MPAESPIIDYMSVHLHYKTTASAAFVMAVEINGMLHYTSLPDYTEHLTVMYSTLTVLQHFLLQRNKSNNKHNDNTLY